MFKISDSGGNLFKNIILGPEEMAQQLRILVSPTEDLDSVPRAHIVAYKHL